MAHRNSLLCPPLGVRCLVPGRYRLPGVRETRRVAIIVALRLGRDDRDVEYLPGTLFACEVVSPAPAFYE